MDGRGEVIRAENGTSHLHISSLRRPQNVLDNTRKRFWMGSEGVSRYYRGQVIESPPSAFLNVLIGQYCTFTVAVVLVPRSYNFAPLIETPSSGRP